MFDQHALDLHDLDSNFLGNGCLRLGRRCRNCRVKSIERFTTISEEKKNRIRNPSRSHLQSMTMPSIQLEMVA